MWQALLLEEQSYILRLQMIQNMNFYPEGKKAAQKIIPFPQRFEVQMLLQGGMR